MSFVRDVIVRDARRLPGDFVKADSFLNGRLNPLWVMASGEDLAKRFNNSGATIVLTVETSGIAPAFCTAWHLSTDVLYARKHQPITMATEPPPFKVRARSPTHGGKVDFFVSAEFLGPPDRVLIIDDFLGSGETIIALNDVIVQSGATLVGVGAVIEKVFSRGRKALKHLSVPIVTLAAITGFDGDRVVLAPE